VKRPPPLREVWTSDKGLSAMLVFLGLVLLVGAPLADESTDGDLVFGVLFSLLLLSGVVTVARRKFLTVAVSALTIVTLALRWASFRSPESPLRIWSHAFSIVLLSILTTLVLVQVFREGPVTAYRIQGAVVVYLLVGFTWAVAFEVVHIALPDAFQFAHGNPGTAGVRHGLLYYSFVTLTTVGYGDITPVHPMARSLAIAEALIGQLYPAILIARLVSLQITTKKDG